MGGHQNCAIPPFPEPTAGFDAVPVSTPDILKE